MGHPVWSISRQHVYRPKDVYVLAGDEVVATKAGKHTHGLDRFFLQVCMANPYQASPSSHCR